jgi:Uma2 family endonuclease
MVSERKLDGAIPDDYEPPRRVSHAEYERLEALLPGKYEYYDGLMYPRFYPPGSHYLMAGGTEAHAQLIVRLLTSLDAHLGTRGPCRVYSSDMKLLADARDYYPDAFVVCNDPMQPRRTRLDDAVLVCEVRSESTADYDKGEKFDAYKQLPSLLEYLILDNRRPRATLFQKGADGVWRYLTIVEGAAARLESVDMILPLSQIYDGLTLDPNPFTDVENGNTD